MRILFCSENERFRTYNDGTLSISNVRKTDTGNYTCTVKNNKGSDHIVHVLKVQGEMLIDFVKLVSWSLKLWVVFSRLSVCTTKQTQLFCTIY